MARAVYMFVVWRGRCTCFLLYCSVYKLVRTDMGINEHERLHVSSFIFIHILKQRTALIIVVLHFIDCIMCIRILYFSNILLVLS